MARSGLNFRKKRRRRSSDINTRRAAIFVTEIIMVVVIALAIVYIAGMKVTVVGNSMEPTIPENCQILVNRFVYNIFDPQAGDVVVFHPNGNEKSHYYVKRVVGTPGDRVQISEGILYVNGKQFDETATEFIDTAGLAEEPIVVGDMEYFVLGDNRNSSEDSRYATLRNIPKEDIEGKAWLIYRPYGLVKRIK